MVQVIGVRFQKGGKIYFFGANDIDVVSGDYVIVETVKGIEIAEVTMGKTEMDEEKLNTPLKQIVRKANEQDIRHSAELRVHEKEASVICQKKIVEHKLEMKLVGVEAAFDNSKITFFFTANGRVDFRSLVKDLASVFKTRIELRQIGVRDEARMIGGLGPCGRQICCGSFLEDFEPVSIKMAKEQNLSLNPTKISGVCGRLMCCLKYEEDAYEETRKRMPRIGREVITPDGNGIVNDLNIVKETVKVRIAKGDSFEINEYALDQIQRTENPNHSAEEGNPEPEELNVADENIENMTSEASDPEIKDNENKQEEITQQDKMTCQDPQQTPVPGEKSNAAGKHERIKQNGFQRNHPLGQPVRREKKESKDNQNQNQEKRKVKPNFQKSADRQPNSEGSEASNSFTEDKAKYRGQYVPKNKRNDTGKERQTKPESIPAPHNNNQTNMQQNQMQQPAIKKSNWQADLERAMKAASDLKD